MRNRPVCSLSHTCSCHMFQSHLLRLCSLLLPVLFWQRSVSCFLSRFLSFLGSHGQFICLFSCLYHAVLVPAGQCWVSCLLPYCGGYAKSYLSTSTSELIFEPLFFCLKQEQGTMKCSYKTSCHCQKATITQCSLQRINEAALESTPGLSLRMRATPYVQHFGSTSSLHSQF